MKQIKFLRQNAIIDFVMGSKKNNAVRGFTIMEVVVAMTIVLMMALLVGVLPVALHGTQQGGNYTEAALTAQHKIDQLRTVPFSTLGSSSSLLSQGIIDGGVNGVYDFSTTTADALSSYFPTGTTGTIVLAADTSTGTMSGSVYDVTVIISWPSSAAHSGSFTLRDKIIDY